MALQLTRIRYCDLRVRQKENYNYQKLSAILADYGFVTLRLSDDWQGADFIAQHIDGQTFLRVQLKSRFVLNKKYSEKQIYVAFPHSGYWYIYPHDEILAQVLQTSGIEKTAYRNEGKDHAPSSLSRKVSKLLEPYKVADLSQKPVHTGSKQK